MERDQENSFRPRTAPLKVDFIVTSLPVGGAETLLLNLVRRFDASCIQSRVVCLKSPGVLGDEIARFAELESELLQSKWDGRVLYRLARLFRRRQTDAVVTVGAGDKMFWGRLAARAARVPVVCSALHSTGWPDGIGRLNRMLTSITDGFIACASQHAEFLVHQEGFPASKVFTIANGVNTQRFQPAMGQRSWLRQQLAVDDQTPLVGIVAALREEKNHLQFVQAAKEVLSHKKHAHFVVVGDGPCRAEIEREAARLGIGDHVHLLGSRLDTPEILAGLDVFCLTSRNEANPISILEAMACGLPIVSSNVGSISETVRHSETGFLSLPLSAQSTAEYLLRLIDDPNLAKRMGQAGRQRVVDAFSLQLTVQGYEELLVRLYNHWASRHRQPGWVRALSPSADENTRIPALKTPAYSESSPNPIPMVATPVSEALSNGIPQPQDTST